MSSSFFTNSYVIGGFATIGGGLFGLDISSMSAVLLNPAYNKAFSPVGTNSDLQGGIVASMPAGSFGGALINTYISDKFGRKPCIMFAALLWVLGSVLQCAAQNIPMLVAGRVIGGLAIGIESAIVPIYQAEITKPAIRGRIVSLQQWAITWGILLQYFTQFGCSYIDGEASFRIPWGLQLIPALVLFFGMFYFPESPRWLMDHGREDEALKILADVHGGGDIQNGLVQLEFAEIKQQIDFDRTQSARSYLDLLKPGVFRRVLLGCSLQAWSQLTGMNIMMYYITLVFRSAGITGRHGNLVASSIQYVLNVVFTVPAIIYIDRWGRRPMLVIGAAFMAFWLFLVGGLQGGFGSKVIDTDGSALWLIEGHSSVTNGIIACSYLFVCSFAITWGPCSWTYPSEIFPMRVRAKAVSLSTASNWAFNFALAYAVPPALDHIFYRTYFIFGGFCAAAGIHVFFCFPETKGRTLEEMEEVFAQKNYFTAWRVKSDVGRKDLEQVLAHEKDGKVLDEHLSDRTSVDDKKSEMSSVPSSPVDSKGHLPA
ncbi:general substrate transporter [Atractiella rhizophila]|nr:general substrate transporter [Atractiella rhizophila]